MAQLKGPNGKPKQWREVAAGVYREVDGADSLAFRENGGHTAFILSTYPIFIFQRAGLWQDRRILLPVLIVRCRSCSSRKRIWAKLYPSILALACLGFLWFVLAGNLLRFTSRY